MKPLEEFYGYGKCESCVDGNKRSDEHPCKTCEIGELRWSNWTLCTKWRDEVTEEYQAEKEKEMETKKKSRPTSEQSVHLQNAIEHFNHELFDGELDSSEIMAVFTRNPHVIGGYFSPEKWEDDDGNPIHEIALNANVMLIADPVELMGVLIHELGHYRQYKFGSPTRNGFHNTEYCDWAEEIGLECYDAKTMERTRSAQNITTKIAKDGLVEAAIATLPEGALLPYTARPEPGEMGGGGGGGNGGENSGGDDKPKKAGVRAKYTCPFCGLNVWAKSGVSIMCMQSDCSGNTILIEAK